MKGIIEQISRIDSLAYKNEQLNKGILLKERNRYESQMKKYRDQQLEIANNNAAEIYNKIISDSLKRYMNQEKSIKRITGKIERNYLKVEASVIDEVFTKLFNLG